MTGPRPTSDKLELDLYRESQKGLRQLADQLPGRQLAKLAREVLINVAQRDTDPDYSVVHPSPSQIEALCNALISKDDNAGAEFILGVQADGASPDVVYLKYLAEAARMLGKWWEEDRTSFLTVTLGTSRIFSIMRAMRGYFAPKDVPTQKSAVFAAVPGEDHTVGIRMATDFFRRDGWDIDLKVGLSKDELIRQTDWKKTHIVGLSYAGLHSVDAMTRLIVAIHIYAPAAKIFVGGQDVSSISDVVEHLDLAAVSSDVEEALFLLNGVWDDLAVQSA